MKDITIVAKYSEEVLATWTSHIRPELGESFSFRPGSGIWIVVVVGRDVVDGLERHVAYVVPGSSAAEKWADELEMGAKDVKKG